MTGTVLVTYGTTNGSTARIAEAVADVVRKDGLTVETLPARSLTSVKPYDAVVVGGGLYAGAGTRTHGGSSAGITANSRSARCGCSVAVRSTPRPPSGTSRPSPA